MAKKSSAEIAKLLEERQQVARWLERLEMAGDNTAPDVRKKVQKDYTVRLNTLNSELEGYGSDLRGTLGELQERRKELQSKETAMDTRLSESKLRHAVGEYDEAKWNEVHSSIMGQLVKLREEIKDLGGEIEGLEEILLEIDSDPETDLDGEDDDLDLPDIDEDALAREVAKKKTAPPKGKKAGKKKTAKAGRSSFDELEFLKKAVGSSGSNRKLPDPKAALARGAPSATDGIDDAQEAERTLKCGDCGEMNLPTEWYCDNCGAELAVL